MVPRGQVGSSVRGQPRSPRALLGCASSASLWGPLSRPQGAGGGAAVHLPSPARGCDPGSPGPGPGKTKCLVAPSRCLLGPGGSDKSLRTGRGGGGVSHFLPWAATPSGLSPVGREAAATTPGRTRAARRALVASCSRPPPAGPGPAAVPRPERVHAVPGGLRQRAGRRVPLREEGGAGGPDDGEAARGLAGAGADEGREAWGGRGAGREGPGLSRALPPRTSSRQSPRTPCGCASGRRP